MLVPCGKGYLSEPRHLASLSHVSYRQERKSNRLKGGEKVNRLFLETYEVPWENSSSIVVWTSMCVIMMIIR